MKTELTYQLEAAFLQAIADVRDACDHRFDNTYADARGFNEARAAALRQTTHAEAYDAAQEAYCRVTRQSQG